ncbi:unnamed protein product [Amoebophrya sp. A25]|nr:unnamed protein product [Amoebophrya sp. A25]|eukprot:GSA25T00006260001.1
MFLKRVRHGTAKVTMLLLQVFLSFALLREHTATAGHRGQRPVGTFGLRSSTATIAAAFGSVGPLSSILLPHSVILPSCSLVSVYGYSVTQNATDMTSRDWLHSQRDRKYEFGDLTDTDEDEDDRAPRASSFIHRLSPQAGSLLQVSSGEGDTVRDEMSPEECRLAVSRCHEDLAVVRKTIQDLVQQQQSRTLGPTATRSALLAAAPSQRQGISQGEVVAHELPGRPHARAPPQSENFVDFVKLADENVENNRREWTQHTSVTKNYMVASGAPAGDVERVALPLNIIHIRYNKHSPAPIMQQLTLLEDQEVFAQMCRGDYDFDAEKTFLQGHDDYQVDRRSGGVRARDLAHVPDIAMELRETFGIQGADGGRFTTQIAGTDENEARQVRMRDFYEYFTSGLRDGLENVRLTGSHFTDAGEVIQYLKGKVESPSSGRYIYSFVVTCETPEPKYGAFSPYRMLEVRFSFVAYS